MQIVSVWDERRDQARMVTELWMKPQQERSRDHRTATQQVPYSLVAKAMQAREMRVNFQQGGATLFWSRCQAVQEALHLPISWTTRFPQHQHLMCIPGALFSSNINSFFNGLTSISQAGSYAGLAAQCAAQSMPGNVKLRLL